MRMGTYVDQARGSAGSRVAGPTRLVMVEGPQAPADRRMDWLEAMLGQMEDWLQKMEEAQALIDHNCKTLMRAMETWAGLAKNVEVVQQQLQEMVPQLQQLLAEVEWLGAIAERGAQTPPPEVVTTAGSSGCDGPLPSHVTWVLWPKARGAGVKMKRKSTG